MIHSDGKRTISNAVGRLEDLPIELLSNRERRERAENQIVEQVLGVSCPFCGSEAAEFDGETLLGCPDCGYDVPDPAEVKAEQADLPCSRCGREIIPGIPSPCPECGDSEDPGPIGAEQVAYDRREAVRARADRWRMENPALA